MPREPIGPEISFDDFSKSKPIEIATSLIRKSGGSLFVRQPFAVELNIPSNIPVRFAQYEFLVLLFSDRQDDLELQIKSFFEKVMSGWTYKTRRCSEGGSIPGDANVPCLVLLDSRLMKAYIEQRPEPLRKKDGVVLFPEEELDIDALNGSAILPENILFIPPSFDEKQFHRCLAGVIFAAS